MNIKTIIFVVLINIFTLAFLNEYKNVVFEEQRHSYFKMGCKSGTTLEWSNNIEEKMNLCLKRYDSIKVQNLPRNHSFLDIIEKMTP